MADSSALTPASLWLQMAEDSQRPTGAPSDDIVKPGSCGLRCIRLADYLDERVHPRSSWSGSSRTPSPSQWGNSPKAMNPIERNSGNQPRSSTFMWPEEASNASRGARSDLSVLRRNPKQAQPLNLSMWISDDHVRSSGCVHNIRSGGALLVGPQVSSNVMSAEKNEVSAPPKKWPLQSRSKPQKLQFCSIVSVGSMGHPECCDEPCKYSHKERGCKDGAACNRCHLCIWRRR